MRRLAALAGALALVAGACGGGGEDASDVLAETASNLREIRSGTMSVRFLATAEGEETGRVGFELRGPFALPRGDELPVGELEYTQIAGDEEGVATFLSTGKNAYVVVEDETYELPDEQENELRGIGAGGRDGDGLAALDIERWMEDPELSDGDEVGGAATDRITARLNVVNAVADLLEIARSLQQATGGGLDEEGRKQLERAVESASVEVLTGKDDRLLRSLRVNVSFGAPDDLPRELRGLLRAGVRFELRIESPNRRVTVEEPADAQPFPEDGGEGGGE